MHGGALMPEQLDEPARRLFEGIARKAQALAAEQPQAGDGCPVVRLASPEVIAAELASSVGLGFADDAPAHAGDAVLAAVESIVGRSVRTDHPLFVNQNFAAADPLAVAGDWLGAALNTSAATYEIAPVFTLLERAVLDKLARLAGFPASDGRVAGPAEPAVPAGPVSPAEPAVPAGPVSPAGAVSAGPPPGIFTAGGSLALLHALQLARHRARPESLTQGTAGSTETILVGQSGHYATSKAAAVMGIGLDRVVPVPCDASGAMRPEALAGLLAAHDDTVAVVATAGTTVTGAFDPLEPIAEACAEAGVWLHVDGAYGASALFSPRLRHLLAGVERADSLNWNLHKMMGMTQQCSVLLVREPRCLAEAFAVGADYLFQPDKLHGDYDPGDSGFMCGRRADVLKLWLAWKARGDAGFAARIDHAVSVADHVRRRIRAGGGRFAAVVEGSFANVCVVWVPPELRPLRFGSAAETGAALAGSESCDESPDGLPGGLSAQALGRLNALAPRVKARMQADGSSLIGFQPVNGVNCFRLIFMSPRTGTAEADIMLELIERYGREEWGLLD